MRRVFALMFLGLPACLALTAHDGPWACEADSDCPSGESCLSAGSPLYRHCGNPYACFQDMDCAKFGWDWICSEDACSEPKCRETECAPYLCLRHQGCTTSCLNADDCVSGYACIDGACTRPPCTGVGQCGGFVCVDGVCATECTTSGCEGGLSCDGVRCSCRDNPTVCGRYACGAIGICATRCAHDSDCAPGYECDSAGKCVHCSGTPRPCAENCKAPGCTEGTGCVGGTFACSTFDGKSWLCKDTTGCSWDETSSRCGGTAKCNDQSTCSLYADQGCFIGTLCRGTPKSCKSLSIAECPKTVGCGVE